MSPERHVSRGSRVESITQKLKERQNNDRLVSRFYTLKYRRTCSTNDLRETRGRFAHDRNDLTRRNDRNAHDRTTDMLTEGLSEAQLPKRTIPQVITRLFARSLLIGYWWLLLLLWWIVTLLPRCVVFVFVKDKRKHKEDVRSEKSTKKYKLSDESKVRTNVFIVKYACLSHLRPEAMMDQARFF